MTFPSPQEIKRIAEDCGYEERREDASSTLFFKKQSFHGRDQYPTLINVFYTTRGIMTKLSHPTSGYNQLWRSIAYDSEETLRSIFINPRKHTGKGYRSAGKAKRGCILCGLQRERNGFSKSQWRKGVGESKCIECLQNKQDQRTSEYGSNTSSGVATSSIDAPPKDLPILFLGINQWVVDSCGDLVKDQSTIITTESLIDDPSQAKIPNVSQKFRGVIIPDEWFDVDSEYQALANNIFRLLKEMYREGGSVLIVVTMGIFAVPSQISKMFSFDSPWEFTAYTKRSLVTTSLGKKILGDILFPEKYVYTKANFIRASPEECLFQEYINPEDYEDDSDYDEIPSPDQDSPVVRHCGSNGGKVYYFGFVNTLDLSWGDIIMKLMQPLSGSSSQVTSQANEVSAALDLSYECIPCDEERCTNFGASICCESCKMTFYCSKACQLRHKYAHSADCRVGATFLRNKHQNQEEPTEHVLLGRAMAAQLAGRSDFQGLLLRAEYWQYEKNWEAAFETYQSLYMDSFNRSPPEQRQVMMGISRCFYEMKSYDHAIEVGDTAIEMNRHFPQVHKYVALAYKAKGDIKTAILTMTKAVMYEAPWDDKNIEVNKALVMKLKQEQY